MGREDRGAPRKLRVAGTLDFAAPAASAATIENAIAFGLDDRYGTVEPGKVAHLLILDKNPLQSVEAWDSIQAIVLRGDWIERTSLAATQ